MLETRLVFSLTKIFPDEIMGKAMKSATVLRNEPFSFQIAYKNSDIKTETIFLY